MQKKNKNRKNKFSLRRVHGYLMELVLVCRD